MDLRVSCRHAASTHRLTNTVIKQSIFARSKSVRQFHVTSMIPLGPQSRTDPLRTVSEVVWFMSVEWERGEGALLPSPGLCTTSSFRKRLER